MSEHEGNREGLHAELQKIIPVYRGNLTWEDAAGNTHTLSGGKITDGNISFINPRTFDRVTAPVDEVVKQNEEKLRAFHEEFSQKFETLKETFPENTWHVYSDGRPCKVRYKEFMPVVLIYNQQSDERSADIIEVFPDELQEHVTTSAQEAENKARAQEERARREDEYSKKRDEYTRREQRERELDIDVIESCTLLDLTPETLLGTTTVDERLNMITKAKRKAARENHPDRGGNTEKMKQVNRAADILTAFVKEH